MAGSSRTKYLDQTLFGSDDGNCFQATIANYLGLPLGSVPNFCAGARSDWWDGVKNWCKALKITPVELRMSGLWHMNTGCLIWVVGQSPRADMMHAVLGIVDSPGSWDIVHDPHPSRNGLVEAKQFGFMVPHSMVVGAGP
jgi:hypothetical protein